jgi:hypothetical protein
MANAERLLEVQDRIVEIDRQQRAVGYRGPKWDQNHWRLLVSESPCGTVMCAAGWTCELDAERRKDNNPWALDNLLFATAEEIADPGFTSTGDDWGRVIPGNRPVVSARERAQRVLGLTDNEANALFYGVSNDIDILKATIADIIAGRVEQDEVYDEDFDDFVDE